MNNEHLTEEMIEKMLHAATLASKEDNKSYDWYLYHSVEQLYRMTLTVNQIENVDGVKRCVRVIRLRRPVPNFLLGILDKKCDKITGLYEHVFCSGLYIAVPCLHISKDIVRNQLLRKIGNFDVYDIDKDVIKNTGVEIEPATFRINSDGSALVLEKSPITSFITAGNHYTMLEFWREA